MDIPEPRDLSSSILHDIPRQMPALLRALEIGRRAASVGFDWKSDADVLAKVEEELIELREARSETPPQRLEEELGDLLFAVANLARKLGIDPEGALGRANEKFVRRFDQMMADISARGNVLRELTLEEMEEVWQKMKEK